MAFLKFVRFTGPEMKLTFFKAEELSVGTSSEWGLMGTSHLGNIMLKGKVSGLEYYNTDRSYGSRTLNVLVYLFAT